jgi:hypothetical protein
MAIKSINDKNIFHVIDTGTPTLGGITPPANFELRYVRVLQFVKGTTGAGQFRLRLHAGSEGATPMAMTDYIPITEWRIGDNTLSWVKYEFNSIPLRASKKYYLSMDHIGYTRDADNYYFGIALDWPFTTNTVGDNATKSPLNRAMAFQVFGLE